MNQWCSIKVTKGLEEPEEGAVGDGVGAAAGWPLDGCPEAGDCLSAHGCAEFQAAGLGLGNASLSQPLQILVWLIREDVNIFGDRGRAGLS